jgi:hypothetical protein
VSDPGDTPKHTRPDPPAAADRSADPADPYLRAGHALSAAGVRWLRLRERDGTEDDLLVHRDDLPTARVALAGAGFHEVRHPGHGSHRALYAYDEPNGSWPKLDIVTSLDFGRWQEWRTTLADGVLERREPRPDGPRPAPDDAFWTLLLHDLLDRPGTGPRHVDRLRELAGSARRDGPMGRAVEVRMPRSWSTERASAAAAAGDAPALAGLGRAMGSAWTRGAPLATRRRRLVAKVLRRLDAADPPLVRRGRTVALLGPDGAGKSSVSERLAAGGPLPVRRVYLGLYGGSRRSAPGGTTTGRSRRRIPGLGTLRRLAAMWRGWLSGAWNVRRGRLVVFDRHPYDARLGDGGRGPGRLRRAILGRSLPRPDVVIVLDAPADLLVARKAEHPVERIEDQRQRYLALARDLPATAVVDVSGPLEGVARRITAIAWGTLDARKGGR